MSTVTDAATLRSLRELAVAVAYRMVGSRTEAEDLAQEAMVRVGAVMATEEIRSPEAFTTTVTTRLAIDHLRSARVRREAYVGPWLPEPITDDLLGPAASVELADSLSFAFLVVMESLGAVERAAFLLREVFGYDYAQLAEILGRREDACRQIVARANQRVAAGRPRHAVDPEEHRLLLDRFLAAARDGDLESLQSVLAPDVVLVSDGGSAVKAARHPVVGLDRVTRFLVSVGPQVFADVPVRVSKVNGEPGFVVVRDGRVTLAGTVEVTAGRVAAVRWVTNPDKLGWVSTSES